MHVSSPNRERGCSLSVVQYRENPWPGRSELQNPMADVQKSVLWDRRFLEYQIHVLSWKNRFIPIYASDVVHVVGYRKVTLMGSRQFRFFENKVYIPRCMVHSSVMCRTPKAPHRLPWELHAPTICLWCYIMVCS